VTAKPRQRCGGVFQVDAEVPADHSGRRACVCGLLGTPGDPHHTMPDAGGPDVQQLRAGDTGGEG
jgi:hypothetical protein